MNEVQLAQFAPIDVDEPQASWWCSLFSGGGYVEANAHMLMNIQSLLACQNYPNREFDAYSFHSLSTGFYYIYLRDRMTGEWLYDLYIECNLLKQEW